MEKKDYNRKSLAILTIAIVIVLALSCVFCIFCNVIDLTRNVIDNTNIDSIVTMGREIQDNGEGALSSFKNGSKFVFTDYNLIDGYRDGSEKYDVTIIQVDSSSNIGSQTNPYVIASTDEWNIFVKQMEADSSRGSGKYFVLGADLDFSMAHFMVWVIL